MGAEFNRERDCQTRDISQYDEWCDTHNQDASLCHLLFVAQPIHVVNRSPRRTLVKVMVERVRRPRAKSKPKKRKEMVPYEQLSDYPLEYQD